MPITCAVLTCHVPAVVSAVRESGSEVLASTRAAMGEAARAIVAHEPQLVLIVSAHEKRHESHWGMLNGIDLCGIATGSGSQQLWFEDAPEAAQAIVQAARGYGLFTHVLGATPVERTMLAPLYFLNDFGYRGPVLVVVPPWAGAQTEVLFGEALRQAAHASGQRWAVLASADMSRRLSPGMPWAQCARAACFDESFIEYLRAGDLRSAIGLEAQLADAAAEELMQCTAVAAGAVAFRTRGHKQFGDEGSYPQALLYSDRAEIKHRVPPRELLQVARDAIEHELRCASYAPPALEPPWHDARAVFVTLRHADGSVRGAIGRTEPICPTLAEEVADCAAAAATRDYRTPVIELDELPALTIDISVLDDPEPVESREQLDPQRYGVMVSRGLRRGILLPAVAGITSASDQVRLALSKAGIRPDEPYRLERFAVSKIVLAGSGH